MENSALGMSRLLCESKLSAFLVKLRAPEDEFPDACGTFLDERSYGLSEAKTIPCTERVLEMDRDLVFIRKHHGHAALGVLTATLRWSILGHDEDVAVPCQLHSRPEPGHTPANDQKIGPNIFFLVVHELTLTS